MVVVFLTGNTDDAARAGASEGAVDRLTSIPASTLDAVGLPLAPRNVIALPADTPEVVEDGKPVVLYYGAEFCPFCAVQRWPATVALSRFGTFTGLQPSSSAPPPEILPNTPSVTYHGSSFASDYITLSTVETQTRTFRALESPNDLQRTLFNTYNVEAITGSNGGIPFMMIGNRYAWAGAQYDPSVLDDKSFDEIVAGLEDPATDLAREIGSAANYITAMICQVTNGEPVEVCATPVIEQAQVALPGT